MSYLRQLFAVLLVPAAVISAQPAATAINQRVEALLKQMTVEEKVGQMTQVTIDTILQDTNPARRPHRTDPAKLARAVEHYKVGSILNVAGRAYTLENWCQIISDIQDAAARTRLKIPVLYGLDSIHGANYVEGATLFPQAIALAATGNRDLARRIGEITALQTRAAGVPWNFYPVMDLGRHPVWPRFWETFGEDVFLAQEMGRAYIAGMQGNDISAKDKVAGCLKHYAGYSFPFNGKDRTPAYIDERMMRQLFLPPFEAGVRAGVPTVMVNSGEVNGIPGHANHWLLTEVLKKEWGFQGFVVSDWEDVKRLHTRDHVAETPKDAVRLAVMAGVDMSMVPYDFSFADLLKECVREGSVPLARIDDAVRRILRVKMRLGLFENPKADPALAERFHDPSFETVNLQAAREAITLLKNENNLLPLAKNRRLLVTGPAANLLSALSGGWSTTWQGDQEETYPQEKLTLLEALTAAAGRDNVRYVPGATFDRPLDISAAVAAARQADVIIAALGEKAYCETLGNIDNLTLEEAQRQLVEALATTGKPLVLVLIEGRPRVIRRIAPLAQAILMAYLPGLEGGRALADILYGDANPSGKLPFTYPKDANALVTYDYKPLEDTRDNRIGWEFPFGHGLSYTTFTYSDLTLSAPRLTKGGAITVSVTVKNTGSRAGQEIVQLFVSDLYRSVSPPNRELKGFRKIALAPGAAETVTFRLTPEDLSFIGLNNRRITEPGAFRVRVAGLSEDFRFD